MYYEKLIQDPNNNDIELKEIISMKGINTNNNASHLMKKNSNNMLLNIPSNFILKSLFLNIKYNTILKLIKYNKSLQKKLGIGLENYKDYTDFEYITKKEEIGSDAKLEFLINEAFDFHYKFIIIYSIIVNLFQIKLKNGYDIFINITNKSLFGLIIFNLIFYYFPNKFDKKNINYCHLIIVCFFTLIYALYEIEILLKLGILIYNALKTSTINWSYIFIIFDIIFILFNLFWTHLNYANYLEFKDIISRIENMTKYYLIRYKNISIKAYLMDKKFDTSNNSNKMKYIKNIEKNLKHRSFERDKYIISVINDMRSNNNLSLLNTKYTLPNCIINEPTKFIFYKNQNIFKISDNKYILKYKLGSFEIDSPLFRYDNKDIINILLNKNLNTINVITQGKFQYLLIYNDELDNDKFNYSFEN